MSLSGHQDGPTQAATEPQPDGPSRPKLAVALDVDDLVEAVRLARMVKPWFSVAKVGLELYSAAGPEAVTVMQAEGYEVFVDLKLLDIPTTVGRAARVLGSIGARYVTIHARGELAMLRAGVEGLAEGAEAAGMPPPVALGITVLTSDDGAPAHVVPHRVALAVEAGCGGVVCAASDVAATKQLAPRLLAVVPGIRPAGTSVDDQARASTPAAAAAAGADLLVIGRAVTASADPAAAAAGITGQLEASR